MCHDLDKSISNNIDVSSITYTTQYVNFQTWCIPWSPACWSAVCRQQCPSSVASGWRMSPLPSMLKVTPRLLPGLFPLDMWGPMENIGTTAAAVSLTVWFGFWRLKFYFNFFLAEKAILTAAHCIAHPNFDRYIMILNLHRILFYFLFYLERYTLLSLELLIWGGVFSKEEKREILHKPFHIQSGEKTQ